MIERLDKLPLMTITTMVVVVIAVVFGGIAVIAGKLEFASYVQNLLILAGLLGVGTGVGRGLAAKKRK